MRVERECGDQDNEIHHEVGKKGSRPDVNFTVDDLAVRRVLSLSEHPPSHSFIVFHLLRSLPVE